MSLHNVILLLGSDLGERKKHLEIARDHIFKYLGEVAEEGEILETKPVGFTSNTMFLNQLISVKTSLSPFQLLKKIKEIEQKMGRKYTQPNEGEKYVSRIIDIDILYYDALVYKSRVLTIPHAQVEKRDFVKKMLISYEKPDKDLLDKG